MNKIKEYLFDEDRTLPWWEKCLWGIGVGVFVFILMTFSWWCMNFFHGLMHI